ncbi:hypothetical protein UFOVP1383_13 [uncultured Caudovirales phage]|uniref:Uncharacterized protein n=1 Tax=uncultured Caudovirales phage TaxID=2100421 RepID=A0A6J5Q6B1_9CAUD|nr:hypothetical protein UFOVP848_28 [uncultured Caudovirales phage]CAB4173325.1 hypothetical protein UFOVP945_37 [uncultured Caudovirales phage]CAB4179593.1 hypothetical protein UFOVP1023_5 [uncultured Caudovirales phage]CAB4203889.1 hypothetical protein UFOVP1383_13 [uncultured Caudovirales phage]CAB4215976.1 hypothetical protein UFOVP1477_35 [uncultured Caudovirales phage]
MSAVQEQISEQLASMGRVAIDAVAHGQMTFTLTMGEGVEASIELIGELFVRLDRLLATIEREVTKKPRRIAWCIERFGTAHDGEGRQLVEVSIAAREKARKPRKATSEASS